MSKSIDFHLSFFFTLLTSPKTFFLNGVSDSDMNTSAWDDRLRVLRCSSHVIANFLLLQQNLFLTPRRVIPGNSPLLALL